MHFVVFYNKTASQMFLLDKKGKGEGGGVRALLVPKSRTRLIGRAALDIFCVRWSCSVPCCAGLRFQSSDVVLASVGLGVLCCCCWFMVDPGWSLSGRRAALSFHRLSDASPRP